MDSWEKTGLRIINKMHYPPKKKYQLDQYYVDPQSRIKEGIEALLHYEISQRHVDSIITTWNYQFALTEIISRYDIAILRDKIDKSIKHLEQVDIIQQELRITLDILSPIIQHQNSFDADAYKRNLIVLKALKNALKQSNGAQCNEATFAKSAYFELFFIADTFGLQPPSIQYRRNDLLSFVEIITKPLAPTRHTLSDYYQKYNRAKQNSSKVPILINTGKKYVLDFERWSIVLELFQTQFCPLMIKHDVDIA